MSSLTLRIPPVLVVLITMLLMWSVSQLWPLLTFEVSYQFWASLFFIAVGVVVILAGVVSFKIADTTVNPLSPDDASTLVIAGIYRFTRNPMYLGMLMILCGVAVYLGTLSSALLLPVFVLYMNALQIKPEEIALENLFGENYREYKYAVGRWL